MALFLLNCSLKSVSPNAVYSEVWGVSTSTCESAVGGGVGGTPPQLSRPYPWPHFFCTASESALVDPAGESAWCAVLSYFLKE